MIATYQGIRGEVVRTSGNCVLVRWLELLPAHIEESFHLSSYRDGWDRNWIGLDRLDKLVVTTLQQTGGPA